MDRTPDTETKAADPLAELIRTAGRRAVPPQSHYEEVYAAARGVWQQKLAARRRRRWIALAASVTALIASALLVLAVPTVDEGPAAYLSRAQGTIEWRVADSERWTADPGTLPGLPADTRIRSDSSGRLALELADGGSLRMDSSSEIIVSNNRVSLLSGKLYFDSEGRLPSKPLTIETAFGSIRDIGTQFEVSMANNNLRIRIREGEIELLPSGAARDTVGESGEEIELTEQGRLFRRAFASDDPDWAWVQELAEVPEVNSRMILVYFRWIARETGKRLVFESESAEIAAQLTSFGGDPDGLTPMQLLSSIAATSDFDFRLSDDGAILIGRSSEP